MNPQNICILKLKLLKFVQKATVFVAYPLYKYAPILLKFKPLPSKNYRCTPVK